MPDRSRDADGATAVHDDSYDYDAVGNVAAISDAVAGNRGDRTMTYDALNRLTQVTGNNAPSPMFGVATYAYDVLDNLTHVTLTGGNQARNQDYCYDGRNQLTNIKTGGCSTGLSVVGLGYDVQGNLANKNGVLYGFDYGNRMRSGGPETYRYDAYGRRARSINSTGGILYSLYGQNGTLLWQRDERTSQRRNYVYLQGSLLAEHRRPIGNETPTIIYQHTDALGSPVVTTDANKTVGPRREYEPYGYQLTPALADGPGYTGHATDAATGLVYMQQRYYEPGVGRFLSVDPVTVDNATGTNFNRYKYAANNPYKFTDPDGRQDAADRFGDQFKRDAEAGNLKVYEPFEKPAMLITASMALGPFAAPMYQRLLVRSGLNYARTIAAAGDIAASAAGVTGTAGAWAALRPGGQLIGQAGTSSRIRIMEGGLKEATAMFKQLTRGGEIVSGTGYKGTLVKIGDDALIGLRPTSTRGGQPPTIDLMGGAWKGLGAREIKFLQETQK